MNKTRNKLTGGLGEEEALKYLQKKGYKILETNFSTRYGEIDLVCVNNNKLIFIEVKAKIGETYGAPEEMIGTRKINQIIRTAQSYLLKNTLIANKYLQFRVDAVCVVFGDNKEVIRINHYEDISN